MKSRKIVVIGSGIAGMAAATRLAVMGHEVTVYEKNSYPGGKLSAFIKDGFHFDAGPSLFTQPQNIEELFQLAGEPISGHFQYVKLPEICNYFFENGKQLTAYDDRQKLAASVELALGEKAANIISYLQRSEKLYNNIGSVFLDHSLHKRSTWLHKRIFAALKTVRFPYLFGTLNDYNRSVLTTPGAQQMFNRYATYNGSNPYRAPGMLSLIPHLEYNQGSFYPNGGMISITNALYALAVKKGVKFEFNATVQRIIHMDATAEGIVVNGKNVFADTVVTNADIYFTYKQLLRHDAKAQKVLKQERSSSALIFYWGISKKFDQLGLHNIFFSENYQQEFDLIFNKRNIGTDQTVYVNITSKMDPGHAPAGKENWFVMVNVPANTGQHWEELIKLAKNNILTKLSRLLGEGIAPLIETEDILDPVLIEERTGSYMGSLYGTSSNSRLSAFFRHPNFTGYIKGLYCCGGSVHPGGGIPLCFKSAKIVADLIETEKKSKH
ncbi:MAG: 1-hydroxycarotenoid 3,4-desaturase CrtD [Ferruginibacter sp.]